MAAPFEEPGSVVRPATQAISTDDARGSAAADQDDDDEDDRWKPLIDPGKVVAGVWNSRRWIVAATIAGALLGVAVAMTTPKKYDATAELLADPRDLNLVDKELTQSGLSNEATLAIIENQVRILTSGSVLTKVVDQLNLTNDPEFNGTGSAGGIGSLIGAARSLLSRGGGDESDDVERRYTLATENLSKSLVVERGGRTFIISISATTKNGEKSALIANTMTEVFLKAYGKLQSDTAGRATDELTSKLEELRNGVEAAERKVETFKAEHDIIDPQGRLITDDEIVKLNEQLSIARARTLELNARAASSRAIDLDSVLAGVLPEELASPTIQALRAQYSALKSEADRLDVRLGPKHPQRIAADAQLLGARDLINAELRRIGSSAQTELKRAVQLEQELASRLSQLKVRQGSLSGELVTLRELERDATAKRAVYEAFLLRARETGEQRGINSANMSVISKAFPPLNANPPSRSTIAGVGMFLGLLAGIGFGVLRGTLGSLRETLNMADKPRRRRRPAARPAMAVVDRHPAPAQPVPAQPVQVKAEPVAIVEPPLASAPAFVPLQATMPVKAEPALSAPPPTPRAKPPAVELSAVQRPRPVPAAPAAVAASQARAAPAIAVPAAPSPSPAVGAAADLDEIRSGLLECREAIRELADKRARRRYF